MSKLVLIIALLLIASPSMALDKWSKTDLALEATFLALHAIDMAQTMQTARHPDQFTELNPIMAPHPNQDDVIMLCVSTVVIQVGVAYFLPPRWRTAFIGFTIGGKFAVTFSNDRVGLHDWRTW